MSNRMVDADRCDKPLKELLKTSGESIAFVREVEHSKDWKDKVITKLNLVDFVIFFIGYDTFKSEPMQWEYSEAKRLNKRIIGIKLNSACKDSLNRFQGYPIFEKVDKCWQYLAETYKEDRAVLLEQYKIMLGSTEKVTEQRLKTHNLFFTITSSILSITVVLGKTFDFSAAVYAGMICLLIVALFLTGFWKKLVLSYGKLNKGKFNVIGNMETRLQTNMSSYEWHILEKKVGYESNTNTEVDVITGFRALIVFALILIALIASAELFYEENLNYQEIIALILENFK